MSNFAMKIKMMRAWLGVRDWWLWARVRVFDRMGMWVVLDGKDGTVSVSRGVYAAMTMIGEAKYDKVYVCRLGRDGHYAFAMDPAALRGTESNYYPLQYCSKTKSIGFAPSTPTVAKMLYDMGRKWDETARCRTRVRRVRGMVVFEIEG